MTGLMTGTPEPITREVGKETLQDLAQEFESKEAAAAPPPPPAATPEASAPAPLDREQRRALVPICAAAVNALGAIITTRAKVKPLAKPEIDLLAGAAAELAAFYIPAEPDPRLAAWLNLGLALLAVVGARLPEASEPKPAAPAPKPAEGQPAGDDPTPVLKPAIV